MRLLLALLDHLLLPNADRVSHLAAGVGFLGTVWTVAISCEVDSWISLQVGNFYHRVGKVVFILLVVSPGVMELVNVDAFVGPVQPGV